MHLASGAIAERASGAAYSILNFAILYFVNHFDNAMGRELKEGSATYKRSEKVSRSRLRVVLAGAFHC